jgi:hypothetical protein
MRGPRTTPVRAAALGVVLLLGASALAIAAWHALRPDVPSARTAGDWTVYYRAVVLKGMLPQLLLALALHPWLRRYRRRKAGPLQRAEAAQPGPGALWIETFVVASVAYCAVAPALLTIDWPGWPALHMRGGAERLGTYVGMTTVVTTAIRGAALFAEVFARRGTDRGERD